jgi:serine/threonine protein kinase
MPGVQDKQYENEVRHLMRLIHPNIVQLVGYCFEKEKYHVLHNGTYVYAEKSERLLCLEYMPKGSLRNHISGKRMQYILWVWSALILQSFEKQIINILF